MHLLAAQAGSIQQDGEAIDLGQAPGEAIFASSADSELALLAAATDRVGYDGLRLANLLRLSHNLSVDLWLEQTVRHAKLVVVRLLGGPAYWPYGVDELTALARAGRFRLALLPGDATPDPILRNRSTIAPDTWDRLFGMLVAGGAENADAALAAMRRMAAGESAAAVPLIGTLPRFGLWPTPGPDPSPQGGGEQAAGAPNSRFRRPAKNIDRAPDLRANSTPAERRTWRMLRQFEAQGFHFRRQVPIGPYFADFACHAARLVVELDGDTHATDAGERHDYRRDRFLRDAGYRVLRFGNAEAMRNMEGVWQQVSATLTASSPPSPLWGGVGGGGGPQVRGAQLGSEAEHTLIPIVFYRALLDGAGTAVVEALVAALAAAGLAPRPIFVSSLKEPEAVAFVRKTFAAAPPAVILNLTGFALGVDGLPTAQNPFAGTDAPVIQLVQGGRPAALWAADSQGLAPKDLAMQVVMPELDGRLGMLLVGHKADSVWHTRTQCPLTAYAPDADGIARAVELATGWARLRATTRRERKVGIVLANYPIRDGRLANGVGYDAPESTVEILRVLAEAGYDLESRRGLPSPLAEEVPAAGEGVALLTELTARAPSSGAARHLLPQGEKGDGAVVPITGNAADHAVAIRPDQRPSRARRRRSEFPLARYRELFATLPAKIRQAEVTSRWGRTGGRSVRARRRVPSSRRCASATSPSCCSRRAATIATMLRIITIPTSCRRMPISRPISGCATNSAPMR